MKKIPPYTLTHANHRQHPECRPKNYKESYNHPNGKHGSLIQSETDGEDDIRHEMTTDGEATMTDSDETERTDLQLPIFSMEYFRNAMRRVVKEEHMVLLLPAILNEYPNVLYNRPPIAEVVQLAEGAVNLFLMGRGRDVNKELW